MLESAYQAKLLSKLRILFPDCIILKNDSGYMQGIPDWLILWNEHWGMLEIKASLRSRRQPNQEWYVERLNEMSFAAFICPENEEEVLRALQRQFQARRKTRVPQRK